MKIVQKCFNHDGFVPRVIRNGRQLLCDLNRRKCELNRVLFQALEQNAADEEKWRNFRKELVDTKGNLSEYVKQRCVNIMVPLGKKAMVRGTLLHTNEVTVSHGAGMFSDVSTAQAVDILDHRIKTCDERLEAFVKERELFSSVF